ncbi:hypothetical protein KSP39_PZI005751 [Platanthera zijinensis]|uniref:Uncharacterized protein n=1 Tax=Platanthera zijinensis TaxID=2320716 RepID=A0AAP0BUZ0_9ASPA
MDHKFEEAEDYGVRFYRRTSGQFPSTCSPEWFQTIISIEFSINLHDEKDGEKEMSENKPGVKVASDLGER